MVIKDKASKSGKFHLLSVSTGIEKKEYFTIHCISEDERTRWIDAFSDAIKANPPVADRRRSQSQTSSSSKKENRKSMGAFKNFAGKRMTGTYDTSEIFEEVAFVVNTDEKYPECVECDGQILKRAVAATGSLYYLYFIFNLVMLRRKNLNGNYQIILCFWIARL